MLLAHYFCPNVRKSRKYRVCKLSLGANGTSVTPRTSTAKVATPREEIRFGGFFSYSTCFLQAKAGKGEWDNLNTYLLYKELIAAASINPKREAQ